MVVGLELVAEHTRALVACVVVLGCPLTHSYLIMFIRSNEREILVRLYHEVTSSGTKCSSYKPMVLLLLEVATS